jgi:hypothetical protein
VGLLRGRGASRLLVLGVAAIVAVAIAAGLRGSSDSPAAATEPEEPVGGEPIADPGLGTLPAPGALPGRLVVLDRETCRPYVVDLARLEARSPGPPTGCRAWFAPDGKHAAVSLPDRGGTWLLDVDAGRVGGRLSESTEPVVFSDDGSTLAQCLGDGRTSVVELAHGVARVVDGCRPAFAPDGSVLTRPDERLPTTLLRDGSELIGFAEVEGALPATPDGAVSLIGYDEGPGGLLAVLVARFPGRHQDQDYAPEVQPQLTLTLWRDGALEATRRIGAVTTSFGSRLELSPSGSAVLVTSSEHGLLAAADLRRPAAPELRVRQFGAAWSPDGAWLAIATTDRIEIRAAATLELAYELPLTVRALAWAGPA